MRLIDADHFIAEMEKLYRDAGWEDGEVHFSLNDLKGNIDAAMSYEQELPRWIIYHVNPIHPKNISDLMSPSDFYICPICGGHSNVDTNYCPHCGEKLGKAEEAEEKQVQPERKMGKLIQNDNGTYSCSLCQSWIPKEQHYYARYCLYCGAEMRGEQNEQ